MFKTLQKLINLILCVILLTLATGCNSILGIGEKNTTSCKTSAINSPQSSAVPSIEPVLPQKMRRANIIFILTDDMDTTALAYMPKVQKLLINQGANFDNYLVNVSLCCPSRATTLLGMYSHNSKILTNNRPNGGFSIFQKLGYEKDNVITRLQEAGYQTALFGKYLNGYPYPTWKKYIPPGWTEWYSPVAGDPYKEYNYSLNENKIIVEYEDKPEDYLTDVLAARANDFVKRAIITGQPFFMYIAPFAPHGPATPPNRYVDAFSNIMYPQSPSFNELDVSDKPKYIQGLKIIDNQKDLDSIDQFYRNQLRSLAAVDDMVEQLVNTLNDNGQLDNTFIFFSSDNGLHMGQHRLLVGKMSPYEEDIRVPMVIRGPGISKGMLISEITGNIDLAPTFLDIAGKTHPQWMDGQSLLPILAGYSDKVIWREAYLIEHWGKTNDSKEAGFMPSNLNWPWNTETSLLEPTNLPSLAEEDVIDIPEYKGLRTQTQKYIEYATGERELYNLSVDPYELNNLASTTDNSYLKLFSQWLACMSTCAGDSCSILEQKPIGITVP